MKKTTPTLYKRTPKAVHYGLKNRQATRKQIEYWGRGKIIKNLLLDQLYRLEGILGKYNCQHGGTKCNFQTNCHRLIREEINKIKGYLEI